MRHKHTSNHEPKGLTHLVRKRRNTAWLKDIRLTVLASDGKVATLLTSDPSESGTSAEHWT